MSSLETDRLPGPSVVFAYDRLAAAGELEPDPGQRQVAQRFDRLLGELVSTQRAVKGSALGWLFSRKKPEAPRGLYVHGGVGRGKTMLMDLFFGLAPVELKRRQHFHFFMADMHRRVFAARAANSKSGQGDPVEKVADALAGEVKLLCFDEFAVTDIADAMILGRLFSKLFERGVILVATSNVTPSGLYEGGINRSHFLPFIDLLSRRCEVVELGSATDYRQLKLGKSEVYLTPLGSEAGRQIDRLFLRFTGTERGQPRHLDLLDRQLLIPEAVGRIARISFADACGGPLGANDYQAMAAAFDLIFLTGVPVLDSERRNEARRLITLIDTLYDEGVKLIVSAAAEPTGLYHAAEGNEGFAFDRTASRLIEMRSEEYLSAPRRDARASSSVSII